MQEHKNLAPRTTLPTGGSIAYSYATFGGACGDADNRWISTRSSGGGTWTFSPSIVTLSACQGGISPYPGQQQMTVTKPTGDTAVYPGQLAPTVRPAD